MSNVVAFVSESLAALNKAVPSIERAFASEIRAATKLADLVRDVVVDYLSHAQSWESVVAAMAEHNTGRSQKYQGTVRAAMKRARAAAAIANGKPADTKADAVNAMLTDPDACAKLVERLNEHETLGAASTVAKDKRRKENKGAKGAKGGKGAKRETGAPDFTPEQEAGLEAIRETLATLFTPELAGTGMDSLRAVLLAGLTRLERAS